MLLYKEEKKTCVKVSCTLTTLSINIIICCVATSCWHTLSYSVRHLVILFVVTSLISRDSVAALLPKISANIALRVVGVANVTGSSFHETSSTTV
jgi:hypothetical protein